MIDFVNLEEDSDGLLDILKNTSDEEPLCVKDCDNSIYYGCPTEEGAFKVINLFSELTTDYQRAVARLNLGIGNEEANEWGGIKGDILQQKDLVDFFNSGLSSKANIESPIFTGIPVAPKPQFSDDSNQIATTSWVIEKLNSLEGGGDGGSSSGVLQYFKSNPQYAYNGDGSTTITLTWDYSKKIESQSINGINLDLDSREYKTVVSNSKQFKLEYIYNEDVFSKSLDFIYYYGKYYGITDDYKSLKKTTANQFTINCKKDEYAYIILPQNQEARFSVNGFVGGFKLINSQLLHGVMYYTYRSVHSGIGNVIIQLLN